MQGHRLPLTLWLWISAGESLWHSTKDSALISASSSMLWEHVSVIGYDALEGKEMFFTFIHSILCIWIQRDPGEFREVLAKTAERVQPSLSKAASCVASLCSHWEALWWNHHFQGGQSCYLAAMVNSSGNYWVLLTSVMSNCTSTIKHIRNMDIGFPCVPLDKHTYDCPKCW